MKPLSRMIPLVLLASTLLNLPAYAWIRSPATTFAVMPPGATPPEGITADAKGNIYVTTFGVPASGFTGQPGQLVVFSPSSQLVRQVTLSGGGPKGVSPNLLGLAFHPITGELLVLDFGHQQVLSVDPVSGVSSVFASMPAGAGINALTFDSAGNVYVSDSFLGVIWRTDMHGNPSNPPIQWVSNALLTTPGIPPFGANGIAFNKAQTAMFVANTGSDQVIRIPVTGSNSTNPIAGTPKIFVNSINGADGLIIDDQDNIWVCANQADEIVVVDPTGRAIAKLGDFGGIDPHGNPIGLLFPASLVFSGEFLYVTNLSLDLRLFNQDYYAVDSQWAAQVRNSTVARIRARIPPIPGSH
jgi:sugar lactone lactonase YvrE